MVRIKINGVDTEVRDGATILEAAGKAGYSIPTLCHNEGLPHYTSCMVCLVKDNKRGTFIASCSMPAIQGMDIDVSGEEVISLRRKALEMLLSEHRAECEAPCHVVCPAAYDIPRFNRLLSSGEHGAAIDLTLSETGGSGLACEKCPGYCENACRRKKIDTPVSIRNLKLFIYRNAGINTEERPEWQKNKRLHKRFNSMTGRLDPSEQSEWLKECHGNDERFREILTQGQGQAEAASCMHCDCRAADDCKLRDLADNFAIKDPRGKLINAPVVKKINYRTGLIFENAKCIKCGLCVRLCEQSGEEPSLCFINRGFVSIISEPLTEEFDNIMQTKSREVTDICPTGALSQFNHTRSDEV